MDISLDISTGTGAIALKRELDSRLRLWAGTSSAYARQATVAGVFEEIAAADPDRIAVDFEEEMLTYRELNIRANRLAHRLRRAGVGTESLVGVCLERSISLAVALVAVLKAGAAFVPFDPTYPRERLDFMFADTQADVVITEPRLAEVLPSGGSVVAIYPDEMDLRAGDDENPVRASTANSLAYVMYTSGSTGRPKGVMVENRAIVRLVCNTNFCHLGADEVILQFAPISFDASTLEIWGALLNGAKLVVVPQSCSLEQLGEAIRKHQITTIWLTAALFNLFVDERLEDLRPVRQILTGGEALSARHVRKALSALAEATIINGYGPTEGTTFTCCHSMRPGDAVPESVPIGRPISNTFVYILDEDRNPVAAGETGELYAGGDGVARGYLNAAAMTAERFMQDPFCDDPDARMYRTGDLARWREDGTVEFLGRIDNQLKISGHRIEPGEIEAAILEYPGISQACVLAHTDESGDKRLVAYFVAAKEADASSHSIRPFLEAKLPTYMVPRIYVEVAAFPLTPNGKLDRAALPTPPPVAADVSDETSRNETEEKVAAVWKRVLSLNRVGIDDNFFDLGGSSLKLMAVHSQLQKDLGATISVVDLFEFTTIRQLASHLSKAAPEKTSFSGVQSQGQKQREAFARRRAMRGVTQ
jgi:amino acid adenylation domain-containing protein